jgi:hypothetical protein
VDVLYQKHRGVVNLDDRAIAQFVFLVNVGGGRELGDLIDNVSAGHGVRNQEQTQCGKEHLTATCTIYV